MSSRRMVKTVKKIAYAFSAQGISLILNIIMSLIIPKILGVENYGFWQLFVFYAGYVNIFHFGINDGVYLRLGGGKYSDINHRSVGSEIKVTFLIQIVIATAAIAALQFINVSFDRKFVLSCVAIYMIVFNTQCFIGYIFQALNQIEVYSRAILIDKLSYIVLLLIMILLRVTDYRIYIVFYIFTCLLSVIYLIIKGRLIIFSPLANLMDTFKEIYSDSKVGLNLTIASIASSLVIGISRFFVDSYWGLSVFAKLSFAISLTNFFLLFIRQIGLVLFPILRNENSDRQLKIYLLFRDALRILLPSIYLIYIPVKVLLGMWLPEYSDSLLILSLLLPICLFDSEMQIIGNTYLKVLRKEKILLKINIFVVILNIVLTLITVLVFNNINAIIIEMVIIIALRCLIAKLYVEREMNIKFCMPFSEIILSIVYMCLANLLSDIYLFIFYGMIYLIFVVINKKRIGQIIGSLKMSF